MAMPRSFWLSARASNRPTIGAPAVRVAAHRFKAILAPGPGRVERQRRSEPLREPQSRRKQVDHDQLAAPEKTRLDRMAQAERTHADDGDRASGPERVR